MAFKMKGSPMKRNFGIGSGSPAKFQGAFIDGKRVSYDRAMDAIESGEGNVELTNREARKYAEEQGDLDWLNKVRKEDRKRIANMSQEQRKEHKRLLSEDAARQSNVDKLNWRENLRYGLTDKEKEERAGSTYDPETGEYSDQNVDQIGVKAGVYDFPAKSSPMNQVDNEYQEGWTGEETTEQSLENFKNDYKKAMSEGNEEMAEMIMQDIVSAQDELNREKAKEAVEGESPMKQVKNNRFGDEKLKGLTRETYGDNRSKKKSLRKTIDTKKREVFGKSTKVYKKMEARTRPDPVKRPTETLTKISRPKRRTIEKAMKKATPYEGFKKEGKKDYGGKIGVVRQMTKPKQVVRKKAKLVEKPKQVAMKRDMTKPKQAKKKTGKISTKTMELE